VHESGSEQGKLSIHHATGGLALALIQLDTPARYGPSESFLGAFGPKAAHGTPAEEERTWALTNPTTSHAGRCRRRKLASLASLAALSVSCGISILVRLQPFQALSLFPVTLFLPDGVQHYRAERFKQLAVRILV